MAVSILNRKRDLTYLLYFSIHLCIMFLVDLATLYPAQYTPALSTALHRYQAEAYKDAFFVAGGEGDVPFFKFFTWMEAAVHVPVALWSLGALVRDDYKIPIVLLAYAVQTTVTTATCIWDYVFWTGIDATAKWHLTSLYGPYLLLAVLMGLDMFGRLKGSLKELERFKTLKKTN